MTEPRRPDPDELLARVQEEEARGAGQLKIFFGAAPGVGKTYTMLEARSGAARRRRRRRGRLRRDARPARDRGAARGPRAPAPAAALATAARASRSSTSTPRSRAGPTLVLVDELAHTNAPGSRHAKRWQDVDELLDAGIDVYTTLNVQHLESLNDVVAQITGVTVRETVPDAILDRADEIELVDLPAEELLERLAEGKVYVPEQAGRAAENFFREGNLIALRELALRRTAERVDAQMRATGASTRSGQTWPTAERVLVCVGPSPYAARLVRAARRMAARLQAEWVAVYVETPVPASTSPTRIASSSSGRCGSPSSSAPRPPR